jgi:plastocyanin
MRRLVAMRTALVALLLVVATAAPVRAAEQVVVAAGGGFVPQILPLVSGSTLAFVNTDVAGHDLVSERIGPDDNPWCGPPSPTSPRRFELGTCPLFWSGLTAPLGGRRPVQGVQAAQPGTNYVFVCSIHEDMQGLLVAL